MEEYNNENLGKNMFLEEVTVSVREAWNKLQEVERADYIRRAKELRGSGKARNMLCPSTRDVYRSSSWMSTRS